MATAAVTALVAASCGGGSSDDDSSAATTAAPPATEAPADTAAPTTAAVESTLPETSAPASGGAATSLEDARGAIVQIVATGTFEDPAEGTQSNVPGSGSGFIIDPSGIAVTNNHVVTGAATLEVFVEGADDSVNARVLGVSECSDLAVIELDGDDYPYLEFNDEPLSAGQEIFALGYPLGDPEYTVLDGVVSKEDAGGESSWASVDAVIEHSADTLPGNSGGPIVDPDGAVVAVNYAGNDSGQSFAIGLDVANEVIAELQGGNNVDSIGINGEAFTDGVNSGIFVYSVDSGSPADQAGIQPGDLITTLEGLIMGIDGVMTDYCDVLRSNNPDDTLNIELIRPAEGQAYSGQINGRALEPITSFAADLGNEVAEADQGGEPTSGYTEYTFITDDSGSIEVSVPVEWVDVRGAPWDFEGTQVGPAVRAAPDVDAWLSGWDTPGVFAAASSSLGVDVDGMLALNDFSLDCDGVERFPYDDGVYTGAFDFWTGCGEENSGFIVVGAQPDDASFTMLVQIVVVSEADLVAADEIFNTVLVTGAA
ncbi:MAG: serine protease [Ilumatobacteraceae bacterium]|nr:serine protease [Ilumatobacteraceae bacterium]